MSGEPPFSLDCRHRDLHVFGDGEAKVSVEAPVGLFTYARSIVKGFCRRGWLKPRSAPPLLQAVLVLLVSAASVAAQPQDPPRVALALSGGAAKGFAHIGVIQVLEEEGMPIDIVTGTSMGALLGGLYAVGYDGPALERLVTDTDLVGLVFGSSTPGGMSLTDAVMPGPTLLDIPTRGLSIKLPDGLLTGQRLIEALARMTWDYQGVTDFRDLPRSFACNALDVISGKPVILDAGYLPLALRTCMSLPSVFRPIYYEGAIYIDGGPHHTLPVPEAQHLGADIIIAVDVSGDVDPETGEVQLTPTGNDVNLLVLFEKSLGMVRRARAVEDRSVVDVVIEPHVTALPSNDLGATADWIAEGRRAATAALPEIRALIARHDLKPSPPIAPPSPAPVRIAAVRIDGVEGAALRLAERTTRLALPTEITPNRVDRLVNRLTATGNYDYVIPRVVPGTATTPGVLELSLIAKVPADRLGLGLRYDDLNGGEILAELSLRHRLRYGDRATFSARLGRQSQLLAMYTTPLGLGSPVEVGGRLALTEAPFETQLLAEAKRRSTVRQTVGTAALLAGWTPHPNLLAGASLEVGFGETAVEAFPVDSHSVFPGPDGVPIVLDLEGLKIGEAFASVSFFAELLTLDRLNVPTRGIRLRAEFEVGEGTVDESEFIERIEERFVPADSISYVEPASGPFQRALVDARVYVPLSRRLSLFGRVAYARGSGDGLPINRKANLGGIQTVTVLPGAFLPLYGHQPQTASGTNAWLNVVGVQGQVGASSFVRFLVNTGVAFEDSEPLAANALFGLGLDFVYQLPIGPLVLSLGTDRLERAPDFGLRVGYVF